MVHDVMFEICCVLILDTVWTQHIWQQLLRTRDAECGK